MTREWERPYWREDGRTRRIYVDARDGAVMSVEHASGACGGQGSWTVVELDWGGGFRRRLYNERDGHVPLEASEHDGAEACRNCKHRRRLHDTDWGNGPNDDREDSCAIEGCMCEHFEPAA